MNKVVIGTAALIGLLSAPVAVAAPAHAARVAVAAPDRAIVARASRVPAGHSVLATADVSDGDHLLPLLTILLVVAAVTTATVVTVAVATGSGGA